MEPSLKCRTIFPIFWVCIDIYIYIGVVITWFVIMPSLKLTVSRMPLKMDKNGRRNEVSFCGNFGLFSGAFAVSFRGGQQHCKSSSLHQIHLCAFLLSDLEETCGDTNFKNSTIPVLFKVHWLFYRHFLGPMQNGVA